MPQPPCPLAVVIMVQSQSAKPSPVPGLLLILAVVGAIVDWRYERKGGKPPSGRDRILFWSTSGLFLLLLVALGIMGATAESLGAAAVYISIVLFAVWEFGRWRMRRKYPLPKKPAQP